MKMKNFKESILKFILNFKLNKLFLILSTIKNVKNLFD